MRERERENECHDLQCVEGEAKSTSYHPQKTWNTLASVCVGKTNLENEKRQKCKVC